MPANAEKNPECEVLYTSLPVKIRNPARRRDEGILQLSQTVRERQAQLGILFDDDGQRCGFIDERGRHVRPPPSPVGRPADARGTAGSDDRRVGPVH